MDNGSLRKVPFLSIESLTTLKILRPALAWFTVSRVAGLPPVNDPTHDFRLRKKVLLSTPELAALHKELVMGGQITENEFWEGREVSLAFTRVCIRSSSDASSICYLRNPLRRVSKRVNLDN